MNILFELVSSKPELEEYIISALINKFGDTDKTLVTHLNKELSTLVYVNINISILIYFQY